MRTGIGSYTGDKLLRVDGLSVCFHSQSGTIPAVQSVSLDLAPGEVLGLVGESGSGKSVTALSLLRLLPRDIARVSSGHVWFEGRDLVRLPERELTQVRGRKIGMIFQEPMTSLNPIATIGSQLEEPLRIHLGMSRKAAAARSAELLELVGITQPRKRLSQYPHELSGGMRQRVMIAMAVACEPKLVIADEPTTALDVTTQAQILDLLRDLKDRLAMAIILITHDLGVVAEFADRVQVMYAGRAVERAPVVDLFEAPAHPYTRGLLDSVPSFDEDTDRLSGIDGTVPDPRALPAGCAFAPRCPIAGEICGKTVPCFTTDGERSVACFRPLNS